MGKKLLKRISLVSTMVLYVHPLLGMENTNPFSDFGDVNINRPQVYAQQQQPQFSMIVAPQPNGFQCMDKVPQKQVIQLPPQYAMTPMGAHAIYRTTYQTVYPLSQPLQYNPMLTRKIQQPLMPLASYPRNNVPALAGMKVMLQQQMFFNPLQPAFPQESRGMKRRLEQDTVQSTQSRENPFNDNFPRDIAVEILKIISISNLKEIDNVDKLKPMGNPLKLIKLVCNGWKNIVTGVELFVSANEVIKSAYSLTDDEFIIYRRFVKGKLIYRPNMASDEGVIELKISDLWNPLEGTLPLEGTFKLSQCFAMGYNLCISTGFQKERKIGNYQKGEFWFTPTFVVEKKLNTSGKHLTPSFPARSQNSASVGISWIMGKEVGFAITTELVENLSKVDLLQNLEKSELGASAPFLSSYSIVL